MLNPLRERPVDGLQRAMNDNPEKSNKDFVVDHYPEAL
jgi:hypothetical protein